MKDLIVMGIAAHPDDLELFCGGTLAKYASEDAKIYMCYVTNGDKGHFQIPPKELGEIRKGEALASAEIIGAKALFLNLPDGEIEINLKNRAIFIDVIRQCNPDIIITHPIKDYHADHEAVNRLVIDANFFTGVPHLKTKNSPIEKRSQIYFMDTYAGVGFQPEEYVDIGQYIHQKTEMLKAHRSQVVWLKEHDHVNILELMDVCGRYRGYQCGVAYAEGFKAYRRFSQIGTKRILP